MSSSPSSCVGESGCMREHDWPDLPATSVFKCEGQCRNATAGHGPTDPSWIHEYCLIDGNFYNPGTQSFNKKSFNICEYELKSDHAGVKVQGLPGKWSSERRSSSEFKEMWDEYALALAQTAKIYRGQLARNEFHLNETTLSKTINGQLHNTTVNYAMKQLLDPSVFNPVAGPQTSFTDRAQGVRFSFIKNNVKKFRRNNAQGQPVCGILGDRAYIGSGTIGQLFSLSRNKHNAATEKVWRLEPKSTFPEPYRTTDGRRCLGRTHAGGSHFDLYPNFRQSVGIMSTTEGLWMLGGLLQPAADIPNRDFYERYGDVEGCSIASQFRDVWVFNPRGWNRSVVLGDAAEHYNEVTPDSAILPKRYAYEILKDVEQRMDQSFSDFRLSDTPGPNGLTIESAIDLGWECTGVQGNWCRKPSLPRHVKGPETVILCFEYVEGFETYQEEIIGPTGNIEWGPTQQVPKRPRACTMSETANPTSNCICYLVNISGQSGYKNQPNRTAFRTEVDYLEVRRADGTFGSDRPFYSEVTDEWCSNANKVYETDPDIVVTDESTVDNFSECRKCNGSECNRHWKKRNLRRKWHEAGRIRYPRVGFMAATLKGEALLWGGECGGIEEGVKPTNLQFDGGCRSCFATHNCRMQIYNTPTGPVSKNGDYMEKFVIFRMNRSGYLFGARRHVELDGYFPGGVSHDESAVSQHFSKLNTNIKYYA